MAVNDDVMQCWFCTDEVPDVESAIERNWIPSFFDGDNEVGGPVCVECQRKHLHRDEWGEFVLNEEAKQCR